LSSEQPVERVSRWEIGEISFPISEAFKISLESIRKRFARAAITMVSVTLGIAFLVSLLLMASIQVGAEAGVEPYMYWLLFVSLLVCGVGITNSMLIAVAERYKEIGTYKTLGALDRHILELFLMEALIIGTVGGLIGYIGGLIAGALYAFSNNQIPRFTEVLVTPQKSIPLFAELPASVSLFLLGMILAVALSLIATIGPAYYASKLKPAEALRYEI